MKAKQIRAMVELVREGTLPRRKFIERMVGVGLTAPMASMMLMHYGVAQTAPALTYKPTKRGGGGTLKVLYWQSAVHLNPHYAGGTKDQDASRVAPVALPDGEREHPRQGEEPDEQLEHARHSADPVPDAGERVLGRHGEHGEGQPGADHQAEPGVRAGGRPRGAGHGAHQS